MAWTGTLKSAENGGTAWTVIVCYDDGEGKSQDKQYVVAVLTDDWLQTTVANEVAAFEAAAGGGLLTIQLGKAIPALEVQEAPPVQITGNVTIS